MKKIDHTTFRKLKLLMFAASLTGAVLTGTFSYQFCKNTLINERTKQVGLLNRERTNQVTELLNQITEELKEMSCDSQLVAFSQKCNHLKSDTPIQPTNFSEKHKILSGTNNANVYLISRAGDVFRYSTDLPTFFSRIATAELHNSPLNLAFRKGKEDLTLIGGNENIPALYFSHPVTDTSGSLTGVLVLEFSLKSIERTVQGKYPFPMSDFQLDLNHTIQQASNREQEFSLSETPYTLTGRGKSKSLAISSPLSHHGLNLTISSTYSLAGLTESLKSLFLLITIIAFLFFSTAAFFILRSIKPIITSYIRASKIAKELSEGKPVNFENTPDTSQNNNLISNLKQLNNKVNKARVNINQIEDGMDECLRQISFYKALMEENLSQQAKISEELLLNEQEMVAVASNNDDQIKHFKHQISNSLLKIRNIDWKNSRELNNIKQFSERIEQLNDHNYQLVLALINLTVNALNKAPKDLEKEDLNAILENHLHDTNTINKLSRDLWSIGDHSCRQISSIVSELTKSKENFNGILRANSGQRSYTQRKAYNLKRMSILIRHNMKASARYEESISSLLFRINDLKTIKNSLNN
ncbi:cache domain-containing protein [Marinilabilia rubra]|uniref:Methyl-accepting chemotaxis protein n=1 Tax=Marinilabilia rubra TaxID=2162893 RepID=A0A2U2B598_9BACT|nr:hypothetical protein [Marinilabilia rubra]PWD98259.1 hypothetical protein DDZ16_16640 [Marinilabilia rubra]